MAFSAKRITDDQKQEMIRLKREGLTAKEIAHRFGVSPSAVSVITRITREPEIIFDKGAAQALIDAGWTYEAVASYLNATEEEVRRNTSPKKEAVRRPLEGFYEYFPAKDEPIKNGKEVLKNGIPQRR